MASISALIEFREPAIATLDSWLLSRSYNARARTGIAMHVDGDGEFSGARPDHLDPRTSTKRPGSSSTLSRPCLRTRTNGTAAADGTPGPVEDLGADDSTGRTGLPTSPLRAGKATGP